MENSDTKEMKLDELDIETDVEGIEEKQDMFPDRRERKKNRSKRGR